MLCGLLPPDADEVVGLVERGDDRVDEFSGGMQRRTSIAVGLLHAPRLLVIDEPTVGVDPQSRDAILEQVAARSAEGTSLLYTSHYMEEVERVCDRVGIMDHGQLIAEVTRRELKATIGAQDRVVVEATGDLETLGARIGELGTVSRVDVHADGLTVVCGDSRSVLPELLGAAQALVGDGEAVAGVIATSVAGQLAAELEQTATAVAATLTWTAQSRVEEVLATSEPDELGDAFAELFGDDAGAALLPDGTDDLDALMDAASRRGSPWVSTRRPAPITVGAPLAGPGLS